MNTDSYSPLLSAPSPRDGVSVPVAVTSVRLGQDGDGNDVVKVSFFRPVRTPLTSFSLRIRLSSAPLYDPDPAHPYYELVFAAEERKDELPDLLFVPPTGILFGGCTVYLAEVAFANGKKFRYSPRDFESGVAPDGEAPGGRCKVYLLKNVPLGQKIFLPVVPEYDIRTEEEYWPDIDAEKEEAQTAPERQEETKPDEEPEKKKRKERTPEQKKKRRIVALILAAILVTAEAIGFTILYRRLTLSYSVEALIRENRYVEAFKIAEEFDESEMKNTVCRSAVEYYEQAGDYEQAYLFASLSEEGLTGSLASYAAEHLRNPDGTINEDALSAALAAADGEKREEILSALVSEFCKTDTLVFGDRLTETEAEILSMEGVFSEVVSAYVQKKDYDAVVSLVSMLEEANASVSHARMLLIIREICEEKKNAAAAILLESRLGGNPGEIPVSSADTTLYEEFYTVYPLMSRAQKRAFSARRIAADKELFVIENGRIAGTDLNGLISAACGEHIAVVLDETGKAFLLTDGHRISADIPEYDDLVAVAAGDSHCLLLHGSGSVTAVGDNSAGQCNVSGWENVCAIAAGGNFSVGLRTDGTLVACGSNRCGQCEVEAYRNVVSIACGDETLILLFADGTVRIQGYHASGLSEINAQTGIAMIRAGGTGVFLLKKNGESMLFSASSTGEYGDVSSFAGQDIAEVAVGSFFVAALTKDGKVCLTGSGLPKN